MNQPQPPPQSPQPSEALGIHLIGEHDPRSISNEEFEKSSDLLFHWTDRPFSFQQHADTNIPDYFLEDKGKETLGQGFYTTPDKTEAEVRSKIRQGTPNTLPVLLSLMPYQVRVFDFRDRVDPGKNGPVPAALALRWLQFFTDYYHAADRDQLPWSTTAVEERYFLYLKEVVRLPNLDLRVMLGTVPFPQSPNTPNPSWSKVFANFVIREGADGVIYNEPSYARQGKTSPIAVFYTVSKLGTYESWHAAQAESPQTRPS